jgi:hypothetical protein
MVSAMRSELDDFMADLADDAIETQSYPEGQGWYGLVVIDDDDRAAWREIAPPGQADDLDGDTWAIVHHRSEGDIELYFYDNEPEAREQWALFAELIGDMEEADA